eukprot:TRINITY_DN19575_c0_g1_i1.p1 TRINITY_DN19575_c0_g1~~TRINITY_DN19575_c0_g1_i1.p1  ORF type:complete len:1474 (+),score=404.13 TRINITY_DN19575_c0_g1_i1:256-4677(+)
MAIREMHLRTETKAVNDLKMQASIDAKAREEEKCEAWLKLQEETMAARNGAFRIEDSERRLADARTLAEEKEKEARDTSAQLQEARDEAWQFAQEERRAEIAGDVARRRCTEMQNANALESAQAQSRIEALEHAVQSSLQQLEVARSEVLKAQEEAAHFEAAIKQQMERLDEEKARNEVAEMAARRMLQNLEESSAKHVDAMYSERAAFDGEAARMLKNLERASAEQWAAAELRGGAAEAHSQDLENKLEAERSKLIDLNEQLHSIEMQNASDLANARATLETMTHEEQTHLELVHAQFGSMLRTLECQSALQLQRAHEISTETEVRARSMLGALEHACADQACSAQAALQGKNVEIGERLRLLEQSSAQQFLAEKQRSDLERKDACLMLVNLEEASAHNVFEMQARAEAFDTEMRELEQELQNARSNEVEAQARAARALDASNEELAKERNETQRLSEMGSSASVVRAEMRHMLARLEQASAEQCRFVQSSSDANDVQSRNMLARLESASARQFSDLQEKSDAAESEARTSVEKVHALSDHLNSLNSLLRRTSDELVLTQKQLQACESQQRAADAESHALSERLETTTSDLKRSNEEAAHAEAAARALAAEGEHHGQMMNLERAQLRAEQDNAQALRSEMTSMNDDLTKARTTARNTSDALDQVRKEVERANVARTEVVRAAAKAMRIAETQADLNDDELETLVQTLDLGRLSKDAGEDNVKIHNDLKQAASIHLKREHELRLREKMTKDGARDEALNKLRLAQARADAAETQMRDLTNDLQSAEEAAQKARLARAQVAQSASEVLKLAHSQAELPDEELQTLACDLDDRPPVANASDEDARVHDELKEAASLHLKRERDMRIAAASSLSAKVAEAHKAREAEAAVLQKIDEGLKLARAQGELSDEDLQRHVDELVAKGANPTDGVAHAELSEAAGLHLKRELERRLAAKEQAEVAAELMRAGEGLQSLAAAQARAECGDAEVKRLLRDLQEASTEAQAAEETDKMKELGDLHKKELAGREKARQAVARLLGELEAECRTASACAHGGRNASPDELARVASRAAVAREEARSIEEGSEAAGEELRLALKRLRDANAVAAASESQSEGEETQRLLREELEEAREARHAAAAQAAEEARENSARSEALVEALRAELAGAADARKKRDAEVVAEAEARREEQERLRKELDEAQKQREHMAEEATELRQELDDDDSSKKLDEANEELASARREANEERQKLQEALDLRKQQEKALLDTRNELTQWQASADERAAILFNSFQAQSEELLEARARECRCNDLKGREERAMENLEQEMRAWRDKAVTEMEMKVLVEEQNVEVVSELDLAKQAEADMDARLMGEEALVAHLRDEILRMKDDYEREKVKQLVDSQVCVEDARAEAKQLCDVIAAIQSSQAKSKVAAEDKGQWNKVRNIVMNPPRDNRAPPLLRNRLVPPGSGKPSGGSRKELRPNSAPRPR